MHVFRLYLFDVVAFVVSYAGGPGLTPVLVFGELTRGRHFDRWVYYSKEDSRPSQGVPQ
jgi:hypothetical protein